MPDVSTWHNLAQAGLAFGLLALTALYIVYWTRDYPGDPDRPPHFSAFTLAFIIGVSALLMVFHMLDVADLGQRESFRDLVSIFLTPVVLSLVGVTVDYLVRRIRRQLHNARESSGEG